MQPSADDQELIVNIPLDLVAGFNTCVSPQSGRAGRFTHSLPPFLYAGIWKRVLSRGKSKCKGSEARVHLLCSKNGKKGWGRREESHGRGGQPAAKVRSYRALWTKVRTWPLLSGMGAMAGSEQRRNMACLMFLKDNSGCCIWRQEQRRGGHPETTEIIQRETMIAWTGVGGQEDGEKRSDSRYILEVCADNRISW